MVRPHRTSPAILAPLIAGALACAGTVRGAAPDDQARVRRIVILHGAEIALPATAIQDDAIRATLGAAVAPLELFSQALDAMRLSGSPYELEFLAYQRRRFADRQPDVVFAIANEALEFAERHRDAIWPGVPIVFSSVEQESGLARDPARGVTGVTVSLDMHPTLDLARRLQPDARRVAVVGGVAPFDRAWVQAAEDAVRDTGDLELVPLAHLPFSGIVDALRALPPDSIVLLTSVFRDAAGMTFVPGELVASLSAASAAPLYASSGTYLGKGIVGGAMIDWRAQGERAAALALRVLRGEPVAGLPVEPPPALLPEIDWRELERWHIPESRVPAGTHVQFRVPSLWEAYRGQLVALAALLVLQTGLIAGLLVQRRRRLQAEASELRQREALTRAARLAVAGELTAAVAHEVTQPLAAILANADAANALLAREWPDVGELREIVADIRADDLRASAVVERLRRLFRSGAREREPFDLGAATAEVLRIIAPEVRRRGVTIDAALEAELPAVQGDRVEIQQVLLNLLVNAVEAAAGAAAASRRVGIRLSTAPDETVALEISDSGPGIAPEVLPRVFEPFFTTRPDGMGIGLSIARSIVEAHGGRIVAGNAPGGGAVFRLDLPRVEAHR